MHRAHLHTCENCGDGIRCTAPIVREDSGSHCANYGPYDPVLCDECGWRLESEVDEAMHDNDDQSAAALWAEGR